MCSSTIRYFLWKNMSCLSATGMHLSVNQLMLCKSGTQFNSVLVHLYFKYEFAGKYRTKLQYQFAGEAVVSKQSDLWHLFVGKFKKMK
jgi:hypothetical protein